VAQRSLPVEAPAEDAVRLTVGMAGGGNGAGIIGERLPVNPVVEDETWLLAVVDGEGADDAGARVISTLRNELSTDSSDDAGAAVKQAFRQANMALFEAGRGQYVASAVALYSHGKYATVASVGTGRAYLVRAGRLNQITRDPTSIQSKSMKSDGENQGKAPVALLGARDRLDSRQPAIYEITLLPEDRLLLCTAEVFSKTDDTRLLSELTNGDATASASALVPVGNLAVAVVATVAAARIRQPVIVPAGGRPAYLPLIAAVVLIAIILAALYFTGTI
jgi:serine/threonine protein phosphatase PrpC